MSTIVIPIRYYYTMHENNKKKKKNEDTEYTEERQRERDRERESSNPKLYVIPFHFRAVYTYFENTSNAVYYYGLIFSILWNRVFLSAEMTQGCGIPNFFFQA